MTSDVHLHVLRYRDSHVVPVKKEEISESWKLYLSADNLLMLQTGCSQTVTP